MRPKLISDYDFSDSIHDYSLLTIIKLVSQVIYSI